jgi:chlorite dismutase
MSEAPIAPLTLDGWFILHQLFQTVGERDEGARERAADFQSVLAGWENLGDRGWTGFYRIVGGGADFMLVHFRPSLEELAEVEKALARHPASVDVVQVDDYVSVVELGMYHLTAGLVAKAREDGIDLGSDEWQERVA